MGVHTVRISGRGALLDLRLRGVPLDLSAAAPAESLLNRLSHLVLYLLCLLLLLGLALPCPLPLLAPLHRDQLSLELRYAGLGRLELLLEQYQLVLVISLQLLDSLHVLLVDFSQLSVELLAEVLLEFALFIGHLLLVLLLVLIALLF